MIRETRGGRPPVDVTEATFEAEVIERSREHPVVVDFWAGWCQPCLMLAPVLEAAVAEREDAVVLARVDVDSEPGLAQRFAVRGIPAVKGFLRAMGKGDRKCADIGEGQEVDYKALAEILEKTSTTL